MKIIIIIIIIIIIAACWQQEFPWIYCHSALKFVDEWKFFWWANTSVTIFRSLKENVSSKHILTSPAIPSMPFSCFLRWEECDCAAVVLCSAASRICSKHHAALLHSSHRAFFSIHLVNVQVVQPYNGTDNAAVWKYSLFILSERLDIHMIVDLFWIFFSYEVVLVTVSWYYKILFLISIVNQV